MSSQRFAFVDVETTGASPVHGRVTEIAVIGAQRTADGAWTVTDEWASLVNPGTAIPAEIQFLTGITPAMVADAPSFGELAADLLPRLAAPNTVFVAHQARFDYGFLKAEFARCGIDFGARTLCTVRLSKLMDPDRSPHSLDALIARHGLPAEGRHRALGDARVLHAFLNTLVRRRGAGVVDPAIRLLLKQPSLPSHLPADTLSRMPRGPGVYLFYGLNAHPLYIGKSRHLRERVSSHFVADWRSERGVRLAAETHRIEWQETAGDLGAQLLEQRLIRDRMPAHNVASRRRERLWLLAPFADDAPLRLRFVPLASVPAAGLPGHYGPFASRAAARRLLAGAAVEHGLCLRALGIERGPAGGPCFNRQLGRCTGCCVGAETPQELGQRVAAVLASRQIPPWPAAGPVAIVETAESGHPSTSAEEIASSANQTATSAEETTPSAEETVPSAEETASSADGLPRQDWHVFDQWCHLGTAGNAAAARALATGPAAREFDAGTYRLLCTALQTPGTVTYALESDQWLPGQRVAR